MFPAPHRLLSSAESVCVRALCSVFGPTVAVRYLRNPDPSIAVSVLRNFGAQVGHKTTVRRALWLDNTVESSTCSGDFRNLRVGNNCYIGDGVRIDLSDIVQLGDNVVLSGGVSILTHSDVNRSPNLNAVFPRRTAAVSLGAGCWIGYGATILPGVEVGKRAVIAAGSVVTKSVDSDAVYRGIPARLYRRLVFDGVR